MVCVCTAGIGGGGGGGGGGGVGGHCIYFYVIANLWVKRQVVKASNQTTIKQISIIQLNSEITRGRELNGERVCSDD